MLKFILGVIVGGIVGFLICAVLSVNSSENDQKLPTPAEKEAGDNDAQSE